ncbi:protein ACCELERATED CELL DEATH 6-like [Neltuma alba]|uniref:protein ACCELERATED CELL DEATH 6-like n=1 Tax=Neltuma alba TaxID=207710 RepID=UPI0010A45FD8|nr:protein ACCELERATED CELL DEATH 6-like [Prosopis alba]
MADSGSAEIRLDVAATNQQSSAFSSKVTSELMERQLRGDMAFLGRNRMPNLMNKLGSSLVDDVQTCGNEKMRELMKKQFSSSVDDMPFFDNMVHIMHYELHEAACDKNADADRFVNLLEQACEENHVALATLFNHVTPTGDSLLHVAAEHGSEQVLCLIAFHYPKLLYRTNMKGDTPLHVAARAKNLVAIKNILDMDKHFTTSEKEAESMDKVEFIMLRNNYGRTALHEAVLSKDYSVVLFLLGAHRRSDLPAYWTWNYDFSCKSPMYLAVLIRDKGILYLLLRLIPIPSGKAMSNGDSPLHAAISERTKYLLKKIVDTKKELLYQRDENNNTPLHYAAYSGYMEGVSIMLETSPMIAFQRNSDGNLPIHLACEKANVKVVEKLLKIEWSNAGIWLNNKGRNILHIAAMKGNLQVIKYLLKHPKIHHDAINLRDVNGDTPLHLASRELRLWTLLLLSEHKRINMNLVNNKGLTARDVILMQCRIPLTTREILANGILYNAGGNLKANMLSVPLTRSINKEWNVTDLANTLILMATLIATVTFAAGFTIPGGFYSSDGPTPGQRGMALLADQALFNKFMTCNTIAMYSSILASIILLWVRLGDLRAATQACAHAVALVFVALLTMGVAFLCATRLIVSNNTEVADNMSTIGFTFIYAIMFYFILRWFPLPCRCPVFRQIVGLVVRIHVVLAYGWSDPWYSDFVGNVSLVDQDDAKNQIK